MSEDWASYCKRTTSLSNGPCVKQNWSLIIIAVLGLIGLAIFILDPTLPLRARAWLKGKKNELFPPKDRPWVDTQGNIHRPEKKVELGASSASDQSLPPARKDQTKNKIHTIVGCAQKDGMMKC